MYPRARFTTGESVGLAPVDLTIDTAAFGPRCDTVTSTARFKTGRIEVGGDARIVRRSASRDEEKRLLDAALQQMNTGEHQFAGPLLHDRIIGALELCCRRGEMLLIQNRRVYSETNQIGIPGATAKDRENRRVPFAPEGRLAAILDRRGKLGPLAYVFGTSNGEYQPNIQTAWGNPSSSWRTASSHDGARKAKRGTVSVYKRSIFAGTTFDMRVPAGCLRMVSMFEPSSSCSATPA
jgi:hypothetical protein